MSRDYTDCQTLKFDIGNGGLAVINGSVDIYLGAASSITGGFKVLGFQTIIHVVGTSATQSANLQLSDSAGSFASPTTLATHTIASSDSVGKILFTRVADVSTDVNSSPQLLRVRHTATSTDATLRYSVLVFITPIHA